MLYLSKRKKLWLPCMACNSVPDLIIILNTIYSNRENVIGHWSPMNAVPRRRAWWWRESQYRYARSYVYIFWCAYVVSSSSRIVGFHENNDRAIKIKNLHHDHCAILYHGRDRETIHLFRLPEIGLYRCILYFLPSSFDQLYALWTSHLLSTILTQILVEEMVTVGLFSCLDERKIKDS